MEGVPTQFLPSPNDLADEAIETAETLDYDMLLEWPGLKRERLDAILDRHGLSR